MQALLNWSMPESYRPVDEAMLTAGRFVMELSDM